MTKTFLEAEWRKLAMANYAVPPDILKPYLPYKTELDYWNGTCYISLVGFMFLNTRVKGMSIPFHVNFEEINLRFYVRYRQEGVWRRGVVFVKEIVPRRALSLVANLLYGENYVTMPVTHLWQQHEGNLEVTYEWGWEWNHSLRVIAEDKAQKIQEHSEEEFILEHYWGCTRQTSGRTGIYEVQHPCWEMYPVKEYYIDADFGQLYGSRFAFLKETAPLSVFLAEGSPIKVNKRITL